MEATQTQLPGESKAALGKESATLGEDEIVDSEWERERARERQTWAEQSYDILRRQRNYEPLHPSMHGELLPTAPSEELPFFWSGCDKAKR